MNIATEKKIINGAAVLSGEGMLALVMASGLMDNIVEVMEGQGDDRVATCEVTRKGRAKTIRSFSLQEARDAKLYNPNAKQSPWVKHTEQMLRMRARLLALRDCFADVLPGIVR